MDIKHLMQESKELHRRHLEERMPFEYHKCLIGLEDCISRMTDIIESQASDTKDIISAVSVRMQAYRFKAEVLDAGSVINEVVSFVEQQ